MQLSCTLILMEREGGGNDKINDKENCLSGKEWGGGGYSTM